MEMDLQRHFLTPDRDYTGGGLQQGPGGFRYAPRCSDTPPLKTRKPFPSQEWAVLSSAPVHTAGWEGHCVTSKMRAQKAHAFLLAPSLGSLVSGGSEVPR